MRIHGLKPVHGGDDSRRTDLPRLGPLPSEELANGASPGNRSCGRVPEQVSPMAEPKRVFGVGTPLALLADGAINRR